MQSSDIMALIRTSIILLLLHLLGNPSTSATTTTESPRPDPRADRQFIVKETDNVIMTCDREGDVVWDREGTGEIIARRGVIESGADKYSISVEGTVQTLTVSTIALDQADVYRCRDLFGTDRFIVDVQVPPQSLRIDSSSNSVNEGQYGTLTCVSVASKPAANLTWTLFYDDGSSRPIFSGYETQITHSNGTITKSNEINEYTTRDLFGARFVCNASVSTPAIDYRDTVDLAILVNVKPGSSYLSGFAEPAVEGRTKRLSCHGDDALPAADLQWFWDNDPVNGRLSTKTNENGTIDTVSVLEFEPHPANDGNNFRCVITNQVMRDTGVAEIRIEQSIEVHYKPIITVDVTDRSFWEDRGDTIDCMIAAKPGASDAGWLHNGKRIANETRRVVSGNTQAPTLTFNEVVSSDKGIYQCISSNAVGITTSDPISVTVLHAPICRPRQKYKYGVRVGEMARVVCHVEAFPSINVIFGWNYNNSWILTDGQEHDELTDTAYGTLNYTVRNEGDYRPIEIQASNGVSQMKENCQFHILPPGPASPPNDCSPRNVTSSVISVDCWEEFDGGSVAYYALGVVLDGNFIPLLNQTTPEFQLTNVEPDTTYIFEVCASNEQFWKETQCTDKFTVTTEPAAATSTREPLVDPLRANAPYIAAGVVGGLLLLVIIAAIVAAAVIRSGQKKSEDMNTAEQGGVEVPPALPTADGDGGQHEMQNLNDNKDQSPTTDGDADFPAQAEALRHLEEATEAEYHPGLTTLRLDIPLDSSDVDQSVGQTNGAYGADGMGDPIYDRADGMVGVTSAAAINDFNTHHEGEPEPSSRESYRNELNSAQVDANSFPDLQANAVHEEMSLPTDSVIHSAINGDSTSAPETDDEPARNSHPAPPQEQEINDLKSAGKDNQAYVQDVSKPQD